MFGEDSVIMSPLAARKRLLVAESEINREILTRDFKRLRAGVQGISEEIRKYGGVALSVGALAAAFSMFRNSKPEPEKKSHSWLSWAGKAVRLGVSLWPVLSAKRRTTDSRLS
jgi:hypothetical protein